MNYGSAKLRILAGVLALLLILPALCFGEGAGPAPEARISSAGDWKLRIEEGYRLLESGESEAALASFEKALSLNPEAADAKTGKGMVLARQGRLGEAERLLRESLVLNPDPCRAYYALGVVCQKRGEHRQAVVEFKKGIEQCRDGGVGR